MTSKFYTYLLLTENNKFYCGYTNNLEKRLENHKNGSASKFTRANKPLNYIYTREFETKSEAMREEARIKKLTRKEKEALIV